MAAATLRARIAEAVNAYVAERMVALRRTDVDAAAGADLLETRILDSLALAGLVAAVERATGAEIDFMLLDPAALATVDGIVEAFACAIEARG